MAFNMNNIVLIECSYDSTMPMTMQTSVKGMCSPHICHTHVHTCVYICIYIYIYIYIHVCVYFEW